MPRRGRHRTRLPLRLLAMVAALLVGGSAVVLGGTALAEGSGGDVLSSLTGASSSDDGSSDGGGSDGKSDGSKDGDSKDGGSAGDADGSKDGSSGDGKDGSSGDGEDGSSGDGTDGSDPKTSDTTPDDEKPDEAKKSDDQKQQDAKSAAEGKKADPFPGRDKIAPAGRDDYVDITDVDENGGNIGLGGEFSRGSYSVDCGVSDHNNSDNYMAAPGKRNGAQHTHDYVGNTSTNGFSDDDSLDAAGTSCRNGDRSTFFWPVLRDLNGTGADVGKDGGSLDGNVGSILKPDSAQLTFRGHGDQEIQPLPHHLMMIMGNAKAKAQDGKNANAKYTCTGFTDRVTDKYPICPSGSKLVRMLDYPSCWDGQNLESKDNRAHMAFANSDGNCSDGFVPIPALRVTLTYDQPAGRAFSIDSFPDNQHSPSTDHSDFENLSTPAQARDGADCINEDKTCINIA